MTYLVQTTAHIDGRLLDDIVDNVWKWRQEIGRVDLRIKEDFRGQEALVADIDRVFLR